MGAIPTQRETASRASQAPAHASETPASGEDELVSEEPAPTAETLTPDACAPACAAPAPISQAPARECARAHATLSGSSLAPGAARALVRSALAEWTRLGLPGTEHLTDRLADDATLVVSELVTNAVVHAGTDVELASPAGRRRRPRRRRRRRQRDGRARRRGLRPPPLTRPARRRAGDTA